MRRILASTGVQQGDPLDPLLFSLVLTQFLGPTSFDDACLLSLWYLDDGTFIGPRSSLRTIFSCFAEFGPRFGLHINFSKCELYWPCGDSTYPDFHPAIKRVNPENGGLELLDSPVWAPKVF